MLFDFDTFQFLIFTLLRHTKAETIENRIREILRIVTEKLFVNNKCLNSLGPLLKFSEILFCKRNTDSRNQ